MLRSAAAVVLALTLNPALVSAQDATFTVTAQSADVYKGPTTVTPVIGHAPRGAVLPVTRNLGSWAKVTWPDAPDGIGYVHLTTGRLASKTGAPVPVTVARAPATATESTPAAAAAAMPSEAPRRVPRDPIAVSDGATGTPITHILGLGGRAASTRNFGATARGWRNDRLGVQVALTRDAMTSGAAPGRMTSMQIEPAVLYSLFDHVSDYVWIRPYVGSGVTFHHQTLEVSSPDALAASSANGWGFRAFAGSELTFASVQRFGLSVELGYRRVPTLFAGFETSRLSASLAGHWYIR